MLGAIIGDVVGSIYEWNNIKIKDFEFFKPSCFFTDDMVMNVAVAKALLLTREKQSKTKDKISFKKRAYRTNEGFWQKISERRLRRNVFILACIS